MKLSEYIKQQKKEMYTYVGSIWGDYSGALSRGEIADMFRQLGESAE